MGSRAPSPLRHNCSCSPAQVRRWRGGVRTGVRALNGLRCRGLQQMRWSARPLPLPRAPTPPAKAQTLATLSAPAEVRIWITVGGWAIRGRHPGTNTVRSQIEWPKVNNFPEPQMWTHRNGPEKKIRKGSPSVDTSGTTIFGPPMASETHPALVKWSYSEPQGFG